jgi:hypothetical protein
VKKNSRDWWFPLLVGLNLLWILSDILFIKSTEHGSNSALAVFIVCGSAASLLVYAAMLRLSSVSPTNAEVDSVYYGGFLITLMVLGASVYELATINDTESLLSRVAAKFGLGLFVTGIGLFFRILLQRRIADSETTQDELNRYAESIGVLNDRIAQSSDVLATKLVDVLNEAQKASRESTKELVTLLTDELGPAADQLRQTITKINRTFGRFEDSKFSVLTSASERLSGELERLQEAVAPLQASFSATADSQRAFGESVASTVNRFSQAGADINTLGNAASAGKVALQELVGVLSTSVSAGADIKKVAEDFHSAVSAMRDSASTLQRQLLECGPALKSFVGSLDASAAGRFAVQLSNSADSTAKFATELAASQVNISGLVHSSAGTLEMNLNTLNATSLRMTESSEALSVAMVKLATAIRDAAESAAKYQ